MTSDSGSKKVLENNEKMHNQLFEKLLWLLHEIENVTGNGKYMRWPSAAADFHKQS